jgi:hypothetical protein
MRRINYPGVGIVEIKRIVDCDIATQDLWCGHDPNQTIYQTAGGGNFESLQDAKNYLIDCQRYRSK